MRTITLLIFFFWLSANAGIVSPQLPSQAGQSGKVLTTNGAVLSWGTGGGSGTVTSVALTVPAAFSVAGSPITGAGTLAVTYSGTAIPIANGGSGQVTANAALNAFLPSQATNSTKFLQTDGTNTSWAAATTAAAGATGSIQFNDGSNNFAADASNFSWDSVSHLLGIGTSTPQTGLDVRNGARITGSHNASSGFGIELQANSGAQVSNILAINRTGNVFGILSIDGSQIILNGASTGFVGINAGAPTANLDVGGTFRLDNIVSGVLRADGSGNVTSSGGVQGTICGWYDVGTLTLISSCKGSDPSVSCPAGFTQKITTLVDFCAAN